MRIEAGGAFPTSQTVADPTWSANAPLALNLGVGQANLASSRLEINGVGTGPAAGPFVVASAPGGALTFAFSGDPNQPVLLLTGPVNAGRIVSAFVGSLDLGADLSCTGSPFADLGVVFNGFDGAGALFFNTDAFGDLTLSASSPPSVTGSFGVQGVMGTAGGFGLYFTAAFHIAIL